MSFSLLSISSGSIAEETECVNHPIYQLVLQVDHIRNKMFELVEIPHMCIEINTCHFFHDMHRIKKAHQYMKSNISHPYYTHIK